MGAFSEEELTAAGLEAIDPGARPAAAAGGGAREAFGDVREDSRPGSEGYTCPRKSRAALPGGGAAFHLLLPKLPLVRPCVMLRYPRSPRGGRAPFFRPRRPGPNLGKRVNRAMGASVSLSKHGSKPDLTCPIFSTSRSPSPRSGLGLVAGSRPATPWRCSTCAPRLTWASPRSARRRERYSSALGSVRCPGRSPRLRPCSALPGAARPSGRITSIFADEQPTPTHLGFFATEVVIAAALLAINL